MRGSTVYMYMCVCSIIYCVHIIILLILYKYYFQKLVPGLTGRLNRINLFPL